VMDALGARGVPKALLSARGLGASRPLVAERDDSARTHNRRVELVFRAAAP
jgi:outer membrane protein OmpA-like peptidoglycan-associated protein